MEKYMDGLPKLGQPGHERTRGQETMCKLVHNGMCLDLLRAVYSNSSVELSTRMKAAAMCLPYEAPKLAVTALISENDFATVLDRRLKRIEEIKAKAIEATPVIK